MTGGKTTRRILQILLALALVGVVVYAMWPEAVPADFGRVTRGPLDVVVEEEGKTRIRERYIVSAPLAGRMQRITLNAGDPVYLGQTLLTTIEPGDPALLDAVAGRGRGSSQGSGRHARANRSQSRAGPRLARIRRVAAQADPPAD